MKRFKRFVKGLADVDNHKFATWTAIVMYVAALIVTARADSIYDYDSEDE